MKQLLSSRNPQHLPAMNVKLIVVDTWLTIHQWKLQTRVILIVRMVKIRNLTIATVMVGWAPVH